MAKAACALCGIELGMFEKKNLVCCGESQSFCFSCYIELEPMDHIRRTRILLDEGRAVINPEAMRKVLQRIDDQEEAKKKAAATDLKCIRCGAPMEKIGRKKFQLGEEGFFMDTHIFEGSLELDVLRCSKCRKVEFFAPEKGAAHGR